MWLLAPFIGVVLLTIPETTNAEHCPMTYKKIGCFYDDQEAKDMKMLINGRSAIDWWNFKKTTHKLACDCIELAKKMNYDFIRIGFYGECKGGKDFDKKILKMTRSNTCVNVEYTNCIDDANHNCVGVANSGYVYKLDGGRDRDKPIVNGGYSKWSEWSKCSVTCGQGSKERERTCTNPVPSGGGDDCSGLGESMESQTCKERECPIDGGFTDWSKFGECSTTCGDGVRTATRTCSKPYPEHGGKECFGSVTKEEKCKEKECPVDGGFTDWSEYSACSLTCGKGHKKSTRTCTNPAPAHGGEDCSGDTEKVAECTMKPCPVNGGVTSWGNYGSCTATCGGGTKTRKRTCTNPAPAHGGKDCSEELTETTTCNPDPCPIDGGFTEWSDFGECTETCGGGTREATRTCTNPAPQHGGKHCDGPTTKNEDCNTSPCPINGGFGPWGKYGECSATCGGGEQSRERECNNPAPQYGGNDCVGKKEESRSCGSNPCPVDGGFSEWGDFGKCSEECGGGVQEKRRECNSPTPAHGGKDCDGPREVVRECNKDPCPIDGGFTAWTLYGGCSATCGRGVQLSTRKCVNPKPEHGGKECVGDTERKRDCNKHPCPIDGGVSKWSEYTTCSQTCGGGLKARTRTCDNPRPEHGGKNCEEELNEEIACNEQPCPIHGGFSKWSLFGECSKTCGEGIQTSTRTCTNPAPQHGGKDCEGKTEQTRECNLRECPIDGGLTEWSNFDDCSKKCGTGTQTSTRSCTNPPPMHGGKMCEGAKTKSRDCNTHECPVDGGFTDWGEYSECSATCGGGEKTRKRSCTNPSPAFGGKDCAGPLEETKKCGMDPCPVDGGFSDWSKYDKCSKSCGGGMQTRTRSCNNPAPAHGGKNCDGPESEERECGTEPCPVDGGFTDWSEFGECSKPCGKGVKEATRTCTNPAPLHGGEECVGPVTKSEACNVHPCPIDGGFGDWSDYGECTVSCGGGTQESTRNCDNPQPQHGGKDCVGEKKRTRKCGTDPCPIDGGLTKWSDYEECSVTCGGSTHKRTRTCTNPAPMHGGKDCEGDLVQTKPCGQAPCPVDGKFTEWTDYGECSEKCGDGIQERTRSCTNPAPAHDGANCEGASIESRKCNVKPCPVNGGFTDWTDFSECSKTCGGGRQTSTRSCTRPKPAFGGSGCVGSLTRERPCNTRSCPVDGGWTDYGPFGPCSKPCAGGTQKARRSCTNPAPQHGGKNCAGFDFKMRVCNKHHCPIDGGLTEWKKLGGCSKTCGGGKQLFSRTCTNPEPKYGGKDCTGDLKMDTPCNTGFCPVDGGYGEWGEYTECSSKCGGGEKSRTRQCNSPKPAHGGKGCVGASMETAKCNTHPCPVDGGYTPWGSYGDCSKTCGGGVMSRSRTCTNPAPAHGGAECKGPATESTSCNEKHCPVNGGYTKWSVYGECSEECGGGIQVRTRECTNPKPAHGGQSCVGPSKSERTCNQQPCPVNGGFGDWGEFSKCSVSCGGGTKSKSRDCNNPEPAHGGADCKGDRTRTESCNVHECPVDGGFGAWGEFGACSRSCGGGTHKKYRECDSPAPAHGGKECAGPKMMIGVCNAKPCPVNGGWSKFTRYSKCSKTCGGGIKKRSRKCNNPAPAHGGKGCVGSATEIMVCGTKPCPVDGGYTAWSPYGKCSQECGGGVQERSRSCTKPAPQHGGKACSGPPTQSRACNTQPCPVNGGFTAWGPFDTCTKTCGGGSQVSRRQCVNPEPEHGGKGCEGSTSRTRACNSNPCPVNGNWGGWGPFEACSTTCGGGTQKKYRECNNPAPAHGGKACPGSNVFLQPCSTKPCPINGNWGNFGPFQACSKPCGGGIQKRFRQCNNPAPQHDGAKCPGFDYQMQACNKHHCPVDGGLSSWSLFGSCTRSCGGGTKSRTRVCNNPAPAHGGKNCAGSLKDIATCNTHHCPRNGNWGKWGAFGACTAACGGGTQTRTRACNNPALAYGGRACPGASKNIRACNTHHCAVNGNWGAWGPFGSCSRTCGGGTRHKYRKCDNPAPKHGGKACVGSASAVGVCSTEGCPVNGNWGSWGAYSTCTKTCDGGVQRRFRQCNNPAPKNGGKNCVGSIISIQGCNTFRCKAPVNGNWGAWGAYGPCSRPCRGVKTRRRLCNNPAPSGGGATCAGSNTYVSVCNVACRVDGTYGPWTGWSTCTKTCGGGTQSKSRPCNNPAPANGGSNCVGPATAIQACNTNACPVRYSGQKTSVACEHSHMSINCGHGGVIEVQYANYGRTNAHVCGHHSRTGCRAGNSWNYVYSRCHNRNSCWLKSNNSEFGDPCWGTFKYLEVKYRCRGGPYAG